jgi:predicted Zn finger-like uncharacterized protein
MLRKTTCPHCHTKYTLDDRLAGKKFRCRNCKQLLRLEGAPERNTRPATPPVPDAPDRSPAVSRPGGRDPDEGTARTETPPAGQKRSWKRLLAWSLGGGLAGVAAIFLLVFLLTPSLVDQKLNDLQTGSPDARARALVWLAENDPQDDYRARVTAVLEPLLVEGDIDGTLNADLLLRAYLHWADRKNVPALIRMVENPTLPSWSPQRTGRVMQALGKLHDQRAAAVLALRLSDVAVRDQAVAALQLLGPRAEPAVLDALFDPDPGTRLRASQLLADYGTRPAAIAAEALARLKSSQSDVSRSALAWFVDNPPAGAKQKAQAAGLLARFLEDLSPQIDAEALQALRSWATRDTLPQLLAFARREAKTASGDPLLIDVLAQFPDERAAEAIALQLKNVKQRSRAVQALLKLGPVATGAVLQYVNHPDPGVQKEARDLSRLLAIPAARQLEQTLADVGDSRKARSRAALQYLARLRPDAASRGKVSRALNAPLLDADPAVAGDALAAVQVWATKENTATLLKILGDFRQGPAGRNVRIVEILSSLQDPAAAAVLAQGLTHFDERGLVVKALTAMGPAAAEAVLPFLQSHDPGARYAACLVLAEIGTSSSLPALKAAMEAQNLDYPFVQEARLASEKILARK